MRPRERRHSAPLEILKSRRNVARLGDSGTRTKAREWSPAAIELRVRRSGLIFLFGPELAARAVKKKRARPLDGPSVVLKRRSNCDYTLFGPAVDRALRFTRFLACFPE